MSKGLDSHQRDHPRLCPRTELEIQESPDQDQNQQLDLCPLVVLSLGCPQQEHLCSAIPGLIHQDSLFISVSNSLIYGEGKASTKTYPKENPLFRLHSDLSNVKYTVITRIYL